MNIVTTPRRDGDLSLLQPQAARCRKAQYRDSAGGWIPDNERPAQSSSRARGRKGNSPHHPVSPLGLRWWRGFDSSKFPYRDMEGQHQGDLPSPGPLESCLLKCRQDLGCKGRNVAGGAVQSTSDSCLALRAARVVYDSNPTHPKPATPARSSPQHPGYNTPNPKSS